MNSNNVMATPGAPGLPPGPIGVTTQAPPDWRGAFLGKTLASLGGPGGGAPASSSAPIARPSGGTPG